MILVWFFVYLLSIFARHRPKFERRRMSSIFTSVESMTMTGRGRGGTTAFENSTPSRKSFDV